MARRLCQFLLSLAVLYVLAVGAFSLFHYEKDRPDVITTAGEFHAWILARLHSGSTPSTDPGGVPVPREAPPVAPPPPVAPAVVPTDARSVALARVRDELLPKAQAEIKTLNTRGIDDLAGAKAQARATLVDARDLLGGLLDTKKDDPEVQALYKRVMELLTAVSKR